MKALPLPVPAFAIGGEQGERRASAQKLDAELAKLAQPAPLRPLPAEHGAAVEEPLREPVGRQVPTGGPRSSKSQVGHRHAGSWPLAVKNLPGLTNGIADGPPGPDHKRSGQEVLTIDDSHGVLGIPPARVGLRAAECSQ